MIVALEHCQSKGLILKWEKVFECLLTLLEVHDIITYVLVIGYLFLYNLNSEFEINA